jgi:methionyl-tRNA formyltransferase
MIKNNQFFIPNINNIVIFGTSNVIKKVVDHNSSLKIKTHIITTSDQIKLGDNTFGYKVFDKFDQKLKKYLLHSVEVEKTLFVSFGCRYIFKDEDINEFFKKNLVNFHGSRLPMDKGGGHFSWRIMRGDRIENQLVHLVDKGVDTGPIIDSKSSIFPSNCKIPIDFENYSKDTFLEFYKNFINYLKQGKKYDLKYQVDYLGGYYPRLSTNLHGWINWDLKSYQIERFIDAFDDPYVGASTMINGKMVRLKKVFLHSGDSSSHPFMTGLIYRHHKNWICVKLIDDNMLLIKEVINSNGKNIISDLKLGDRFYTPTKKLDNKNIRVKYNSKGIIKKN